MPHFRRALRLGFAVLGAVAIFSCDGSTETVDLTPAALQKVSGDQQPGVVGRQLSDPLVVRVTNADGDPIAGVLVNFVVTSGGGSVFAGSGLTNSSGIAQERWTLGTSTSVMQRVEARAVDNDSGEPIVFATFTAVASPDVPAALEKSAGDGQQATVAAPVAIPPLVIVRDQYGNPVPGVLVAFEVVSGGGNIEHATVTSNAQGHASVGRWTLGPVAQPQTLRASAQGVVPVIFTVTPGAGAATRLVFEGMIPTTAQSGVPLAPIVVRLQDAHGNPVRLSGTQVTAALAEGEGALHGTTTVATDADGAATFSSIAIAGSAGSKTLRFTAGSLTAASMPIALAVGTPAVMIALAGSDQVIPAGGSATVAPSVRVTDAAGNRLAGVPVTFGITEGGGSLTAAMQTTDVNGVATVGSWTVGTAPGAATLRASASGTPGVTFAATIVAGAPSVLTKVAGDNQSATVGTQVSVAPKVRVTDAHGNPVSGATVTFTVASGGGSVTNAAPATNASGEAPVGSWTLGTVAGENTLRASVGGLSVVFTATGTPQAGAGARITVVSGSVDEALPDAPLPGKLVARVTDDHGNPLPGVLVHWQWYGGSLTPDRAAQCTSMEERVRGLRWCQTNRESYTDAQGYAHAARHLGNIIGDRQVTRVSYGSASTSFEHPIVDVFTANKVAIGGMKCVLRNGQPFCFTTGRAEPVAGGPSFESITVGTSHACGLTPDGVAYCWGDNRYGQLGDGGTSFRQTPAPVAGNVRFESISSQYDHTCAVTADGTSYCWGSNASSQLGSTTTAQCLSPSGGAVPCAVQPQPVSTTLRFRQVSTGDVHTCAVAENGSGWCWGTGTQGELGNGQRSTSATPTEVLGGRSWVEIKASRNSACGLTSSSVMCWGNPLGLELEPRQVRGAGAVSIAHGESYVCVLEADGRIYCEEKSGINSTISGYLGTGSTVLGYPERGNGDGYVATSKRFTAVEAGRFSTCGIAESGQVYCWGLMHWPDFHRVTWLPSYVHPPAP